MRTINHLSEIPRSFPSDEAEEKWWAEHELANDLLARMLRRHDRPKDAWIGLLILCFVGFTALSILTVIGKAIGWL